MKIDEKHLMQIAAIVNYGGITEAASILGLSQPAISRNMSFLEKHLGDPIFIKGKRPLRPTALGQLLAIHGQIILEASRKASESAQNFQLGRSGIVRVCGVPYFMDALISDMIASFQLKEPDIRVDLSYGHLTELMNQLEGNQIDLAIGPLGLAEAGADLNFLPILPGRNVVACSSHHPLLTKDRLATTDVMDYPWVAPLPDSPLRADLHSILLTLGIREVSIRYSGGSLMSLVNYVSKTTALAILPHSVVFSMRHENRIQVLPIEIPQPERTLGILTKSTTPMTPAAEKFSAHIVDQFHDLKDLITHHEKSIMWGN